MYLVTRIVFHCYHYRIIVLIRGVGAHDCDLVLLLKLGINGHRIVVITTSLTWSTVDFHALGQGWDDEEGYQHHFHIPLKETPSTFASILGARARSTKHTPSVVTIKCSEVPQVKFVGLGWESGNQVESSLCIRSIVKELYRENIIILWWIFCFEAKSVVCHEWSSCHLSCEVSRTCMRRSFVFSRHEDKVESFREREAEIALGLHCFKTQRQDSIYSRVLSRKGSIG